MLSYEGTPAIYIHSLFATKNDISLFKEIVKMKRSINRHTYDYGYLIQKLNNNSSLTNNIFTGLIELIKIRKKQKAFSPNATQYTLNLGKNLFGVWAKQ